jgi:hypothetical protein
LKSEFNNNNIYNVFGLRPTVVRVVANPKKQLFDKM